MSDKKHSVSFNVTKRDAKKIMIIAQRASQMAKRDGGDYPVTEARWI